MRSLALLVALLIPGLSWPHALASPPSEDGFFVVDPAKWGTPRIVVPPEYPKDALANAVSGYVDVEGVVDPEGPLDAVTYTPGSPESSIVDPLREVVRFWVFNAPLDRNCAPTSERVSTRVWFEVVEGKPKVSISRRPMAYEQGLPAFINPTKRVSPEYPRAVLKQPGNTTASVYAALKLAPEGRVSEVSLVVYTKVPMVKHHFESATRAALLLWEFPPLDSPTASRGRVGCVTIDYRIRE